MPRPSALSLWRPWPKMMIHAGKDVENRSWNTAARGDVLLHAANGVDHTALGFARDLAKTGPAINLDQADDDPATHPLGIVAVAELYDVCAFSVNNPGQQCPCPPWAQPGRYHWRIRNVAAFPQPVPHPGQQRMWAVKDKAWPAVYTQLKAVGRA